MPLSIGTYTFTLLLHLENLISVKGGAEGPGLFEGSQLRVLEGGLVEGKEVGLQTR